jgi:hypothetical protein
MHICTLENDEPNTIKVIKSNRRRWAGHVACKEGGMVQVQDILRKIYIYSLVEA